MDFGEHDVEVRATCFQNLVVTTRSKDESEKSNVML